MLMYALHPIKSHTTGKVYAARGDEVEVYCLDHYPVYCCLVGSEMFGCHKDRLSEEPIPGVEPMPEKSPQDWLYETMQAELKKGRTKFKTLVGCVRDGLINKPFPPGIDKETWLLTAKNVLQ